MLWIRLKSTDVRVMRSYEYVSRSTYEPNNLIFLYCHSFMHIGNLFLKRLIARLDSIYRPGEWNAKLTSNNSYISFSKEDYNVNGKVNVRSCQSHQGEDSLRLNKRKLRDGRGIFTLVESVAFPKAHFVANCLKYIS